mgnify:FL=1
MKTTYYTVAGHHFSLQMSSDHPLWQRLNNYAPFASQSEAAPLLFSLRVLPDAAPLFRPDIAKHILTDTSDDDMPRIELYEQAGSMLFRIAIIKNADICCEFLASQDYSSAELSILSSAVPSPLSGIGRFPVDNALMLLYAFRTAPRHTLEMHASVIKKEGRACLFLGRSGTGKSTHSRQWLTLFPDAALLNDDNPIVRCPAPPSPHGDTAHGDTTHGDTAHGISAEPAVCYGSPWSGKTPCYKNDSAPIAAFVLLEQAPENSIRRLTLPEAYAAIYSSSSGLRCVPQ